MFEKILRDLKKYIIENFMVEEDEVCWNESLVDQGVIDSIGLIEIVDFLESHYDIIIKDSNITRENFGSAEKIAYFTESLCRKKDMP